MHFFALNLPATKKIYANITSLQMIIQEQRASLITGLSATYFNVNLPLSFLDGG